jgi:hypothetical protein
MFPSTLNQVGVVTVSVGLPLLQFGHRETLRQSSTSRRDARGDTRSLKPCFRVTAGGGNNEVRICTNTSCRKMGSKEVLQHFNELVDLSQVRELTVMLR